MALQCDLMPNDRLVAKHEWFVQQELLVLLEQTPLSYQTHVAGACCLADDTGCLQESHSAYNHKH